VELQAWQPSSYPDDIPRIGIRSVWLLACITVAAGGGDTLHVTSNCASMLNQLCTHVVTYLYICCMMFHVYVKLNSEAWVHMVIKAPCMHTGAPS